jgi:hypothetical protein
MKDTKGTIKAIFTDVKDPRVVGRRLHQLTDVLFIAFCTLLANGEDYEDMVEFGKQRVDWLKTVLNLPNGIPSHDTFNRVFQLLDPPELSKLLAQDERNLLGCIAEKQLILDGKKLRGEAPKSEGNKALYILNAWVGENRLCIGQR